ncbi:membrane protein insertase YidC [Alkalisalibacterium limincola]|uniref:membrane protein insertase YidC n=1 Tax=Alkalisalibacterium limincola TaxID=2699169 RepID=UPI002103E236|nr:membrane protein insertase YidC [Alkalisalibacterium limincola]
MTQTRTFLIFAWIFVAFLLWQAWDNHFRADAPVVADSPTMTQADPSVLAQADSTVPSAEGLAAPAAPDAAGVPAAPGDVAAPAAAAPTGQPVDVFTDVLHLQIDPRGGTILRAELLGYGLTADADAPPVALLDTQPATYFVAQFGLTSASDVRPSHEEAFRTEDGSQSFRLAEGQDALEVPFVWTHESGLSVRRVFRLERDSYVLQVREEVRNDGDSAWIGAPYCQLQRVEPVSAGSGFTNPQAYAFTGGAFYTPSERYTKVRFDNFAREGARLPQNETGWIAMLQHHFTAACIADTPVGAVDARGPCAQRRAGLHRRQARRRGAGRSGDKRGHHHPRLDRSEAA